MISNKKTFHRLFPMLHNSRSGFTLIEIIIVISITAILSSFMISYNHTSRQQLALYAEEMKLAQTIFRAKSLAISSYAQSSTSGACGYGVHIDYSAMAYSVFSYNKPSGLACQKIKSIEQDYKNIVSTSKMDRNVRFKMLPGLAKNMDDVLFIPPDPLTILNSNGQSASEDSASITLETLDKSLSGTIIVNSAGLIDF